MTRVILTESELAERLAFWQDVVRLRDWTVSVRIARQAEIEADTHGKKVGGILNYQEQHRHAVISVLHPDDWTAMMTPPPVGFEQDMEFTIVHELLHLHLLRVDPQDEHEFEVEVAINAITDGLLRLRRCEAS